MKRPEPTTRPPATDGYGRVPKVYRKPPPSIREIGGGGPPFWVAIAILVAVAVMVLGVLAWAYLLELAGG